MREQPEPISPFKIIAASLVALILLSALSVGGCAGVKSFDRAQKRADAKNRTAIVKQNIKTAEQQAHVIHAQNATVQAQAEQRLIEAKGIRHAQDEISATLTPYYLQHEAIKSQQAVATSGKNNTIIYTPSGPNGVPLVQTPPLKQTQDLGGSP